MRKERLDVWLVEKGLSPSRERAKASVMAGRVYVDGRRVEKAGAMVKEDARIAVTGDEIGYVSRGGLKLAKALTAFALDLTGAAMADIGASTGGFTDCALKNGAARVYAIDVGYGQLAWSLRTDGRVVNMERTNIRHVTPADIGEALDFVCIDVAFISLTKVLPAAAALLRADGAAVCLIKPQFEAGREKVGKKGVVRDAAVHEEVIVHILTFCRTVGLTPLDLTFSPVKGPEGNIEYLLYLRKSAADDETAGAMPAPAAVVARAHAALS